MTPAGIYDFNLSTGVLSFESDFGAASPTYFEFSPNGSYLHATILNQATSLSELVQFDIARSSQTGQTLESTAQVVASDFNGFYLQLASDGKIYYTDLDIDLILEGLSTSIGSINCPNTSSPSITAGIFSYPIDSQTTFPFFSLPNFPSWIFYNNNDVQIEFGPDTVYLCEGDTLELNAGEGTSWSWGGDAASNTGQFYTVTSPGIYSATVTGTCGLGSDQIVVLPCETPGPLPFGLSFPNVITVNGDGVNDLFEIQNLPENTDLIVLNRWGNVVFSSVNYLNNWDGKDTLGKELVDGVYTYRYATSSGTNGHGFVHFVR